MVEKTSPLPIYAEQPVPTDVVAVGGMRYAQDGVVVVTEPLTRQVESFIGVDPGRTRVTSLREFLHSFLPLKASLE